MFRYYLAYDDGNTIIRVDRREQMLPQRFNPSSASWVEDIWCCGMYCGCIPVKRIKAWKVIYELWRTNRKSRRT